MSSTQDFTKTILQSNLAFANTLYQILSRKPGNVFFSPFSLHVILAMVYQGARTTTAETIAKVLQIPNPPSTALGYKEIIHHLTTIQNVVLSIAFKIYLKKELQLLLTFKNIVKDYFDSEVEAVDFKKKTETTEIINKWVLQKTQGKIKEIVKKQSISSSSLFLLNALYFKGDWASPFWENETRERPFYLDDEQVVLVQMMEGTKFSPFKIDKQLNAKILSLPYANGDIHMVIILPNEKNGIGNLESALASMNLSEVFTNLHDREVEVSLPKFKFETSVEMDEVVKEMGLGLIYSETQADFTGMVKLCSDENLFVSRILQKACIEVNEKGAEAAAVTVVEMECTESYVRIIRKVQKFVVDHPSMFMIVEGKGENANILFFGRLYHPKY